MCTTTKTNPSHHQNLEANPCGGLEAQLFDRGLTLSDYLDQVDASCDKLAFLQSVFRHIGNDEGYVELSTQACFGLAQILGEIQADVYIEV